MKKIILLGALILSVVSCSACKKAPDSVVVDAQPPVDASVPPVENPLTIKGAHWEFTLPTDNWKPVTQAVPVGTTVFVNENIKGAIIFEEKIFPGTLDVLAVNNLRAIRNSGATIVSAKQTNLNGYKFVLVEATKSTNRIWVWMTTTGTYAYAFSCGGDDQPPTATMQLICSSTADTLHLK